MPEPNGQVASTKSEIKDNAVHAGPSDLLKLSQTDSVLSQMERLISFFPQKTWYLVTQLTWVAVVDTSTEHGTISPTLVLYQTHASHTVPQVELPQLANPSAQMEPHGKNTNAPQDQLYTQQPSLESRVKSTQTDQLKVPSTYTLTS